MKKLIELMIESGAGDAAALKYSDCDIINERLAGKIPFKPQSVCIGTIPYYTHFCNEEKKYCIYCNAELGNDDIFVMKKKMYQHMHWHMIIIHTYKNWEKISSKERAYITPTQILFALAIILR